jgi:hypothetical protein
MASRDSLRARCAKCPTRTVSPTLRVHHLREVEYPTGSELHTMQMLARFEPPKFGSEGRSPLWPRSRSGPRPLRPARRKSFYTSTVSGGSRRSESLFTASISRA